MALHDEWAKIVASALDWEQAHANFDKALKDLPSELRGRRPENFPHSVWELVFHIDVAQHDLLEFCRNPKYEEIKWPDDYWPKNPAPASDRAWDECIARIRRDVEEFKQFPLPEHSELTVLSVAQSIHIPFAQLNPLARPRAHQDIAEIERAELEIAQKAVVHASHSLQETSRKIETIVLKGDAARKIIQVAKASRADLLVVGSRGQSISRPFQLGNVAQRVLEYAPCSVLVVKPF
jgi:nucleotide-binding universal stress UspA family protein